MLGRLKYLVGILIFSAIIASFVEGQGMSSNSDAAPGAAPNLVMQHKMSDGIVGAFLRYLQPFTKVLFQFVNSALIRTSGVQLPCTIYNLARLEYTCTPVKVNVTMSSTTTEAPDDDAGATTEEADDDAEDTNEEADNDDEATNEEANDDTEATDEEAEESS